MIQNRDLIMMSLSRFFSMPEHIRPVVDIVSGRSDLSLRLIDWFVTNYAKDRDIVHRRAAADCAFVNVYLSYRAQLKTYSKQNFDPFRRNERITFAFGPGEDDCVETTTAQLCFFRWSIENDVLGYIRAHKAEVEAEMLGKGKRPTPPCPSGSDRPAGAAAEHGPAASHAICDGAAPPPCGRSSGGCGRSSGGSGSSSSSGSGSGNSNSNGGRSQAVNASGGPDRAMKLVGPPGGGAGIVFRCSTILTFE
jgi:uncharacterized membrane protein YgcG